MPDPRANETPVEQQTRRVLSIMLTAAQDVISASGSNKFEDLDAVLDQWIKKLKDGADSRVC